MPTLPWSLLNTPIRIPLSLPCAHSLGSISWILVCPRAHLTSETEQGLPQLWAPCASPGHSSSGGRKVEGRLAETSGRAEGDRSPAPRGLHWQLKSLPQTPRLSGSSLVLTAEKMTRKASSSMNQWIDYETRKTAEENIEGFFINFGVWKTFLWRKTRSH